MQCRILAGCRIDGQQVRQEQHPRRPVLRIATVAGFCGDQQALDLTADGAPVAGSKLVEDDRLGQAV